MSKKPSSGSTANNGAARRRTARGRGACTVEDVRAAMEVIAPTALAQSWDNVGLLAGDQAARVRRMLVAIDLTHRVLEEAVRLRVELLLAYHPPIFKPIGSLSAPGAGMESLVFECIHNGIAIYSTHTALDAAEGGTNDVLMSLCGVSKTEPLEYVDRPGPTECKLVVFVPLMHLENVSDAMFAAGAGRIGDYESCSFRSEGTGTFFGTKGTNPAVGRSGRLETVEEVRLEVVVPSRRLPEVVSAMRAAHPYEEPAFDVYPLKAPPVRGIGRIGSLVNPVTLASLARKLHASTKADTVQIVGDANHRISRVIAVAGASGSLPFRAGLRVGDVVVTGEMRHHDALAIRRADASAIVLGHWASERPALGSLAKRLAVFLPNVEVCVSQADVGPFRRV